MRACFKLAIAAQLVGVTGVACFDAAPRQGGYTYSSVNSSTLNDPNDPNASGVPPIDMTAARRDPNYSAGPNSKYNAVADFDADGRPDVVVTNNVLNSIRIYNDPGVNFNVTPTVIPLGDGPRHVLALDLNHDQSIDLAVVTDQNIVILLNSGNGTFSMAQTYGLGGTGGYRVASADFNGDSYPDLVVAGMSSALAVFINNGDGSFANGFAVTIASTSRVDVSAGDVTGDGKPDIVAVTSNPVAMQVLANQGNGTFAPPVAYDYQTSGHVIPLFDLDGDGHLDALMADEAHTVTVAFNDGKGGFAAHQLYSLDSNAWVDDIAFGDLNGDGLPDLALSTWSGSDVTVLPNEGHGKLGDPQHFPTPDRNWQTQIADFNGDGKLDMAVCGETYTLTMMLNQTP